MLQNAPLALCAACPSANTISHSSHHAVHVETFLGMCCDVSLPMFQVAPGEPQESSCFGDSRMHRILCPQTAALSIADVITNTPGPRHTKLMCVLDPSAFTMGTGSRHKAKRPEGLLARLSMGSVGASSPSKSSSPIKSSEIKVCPQGLPAAHLLQLV